MTDRTRNIALGLTTLIALLGLGWLLMAFGELAITGPDRYTLLLRVADAGGVTGTSEVTLNGVSVGRIVAAATDVDPRRGVILTLAIDRAVRIPTDVGVRIQQDFLGSTRLALVAHPASEGTELSYFEPGAEFRRDVRGQIESLTAQLTARMDEIADAAASFKELSETYVRVGERLEAVLLPRTPEDVDAGAGPANLPSTLARLDTAIASANQWLGDESLRTDAQSTVTSARSLLEKASTAVDAWTTAAQSLDSRTADLSTRAADTMASFTRSTEELNAMLTQARTVMRSIADGQGTLGQLATNPDLYKSLNDAAMQLEEALRDARLLIEKFRVEGVPIQF
jgi:phospholipid/cholesterol/gamma-HCH transport system substrate-binding protein